MFYSVFKEQTTVEEGYFYTHFGLKIAIFGRSGGVSEERIEMNRRLVKPCVDKFEEADIVNLVWQEKKFRFTLWNKIYNGDICRKAFERVEDGRFPKAQDLYAFFIIASLSHSTAGIKDELYHYNFGIGVTGGDVISLRKFDILLQEKLVYDALVRFAAEEGRNEDFREALEEIKHGFLSECVNKYISNLRLESTSDGFHHLMDTWGFEDVICMIAENYWTERAAVAQKMAEVDIFARSIDRHTDKKRLTIAAYYRNIKNGGAQRVVATLCNIWHNILGDNGEPLYRIVLITDEQKLEDEYNIDEDIVRCYLPAYDVYTKGAYRERLRAWDRILTEQDIDIVVDSMWIAQCTIYDMLCIKHHKNHPLFLIHAHSFCTAPYQNERGVALAQLSVYQMCDGVVTLSECDKEFVGSFCPHVKYIVNPIEIKKEEINQNKEGNTLVWVGRLSSEKRPLDVIYMMDYLVKTCPNTVLYIVGAGDEAIRMQMEETIRELHLTEHIIMEGFQVDVDQYYQKASVFLGTSEYEGFSLTISEALSYAVPVVSYDLPWLTFMRDGRGIIPVRQGRPDLMAKEVAELLQNPEKAFAIGQEGRKQIEELTQTDLEAEWKEFFEGAGKVSCNTENNSSEAILFRYLTIFQQKGKDKLRSSMNIVNKEKNKLKRESEKQKKINGRLEEKTEKLEKKNEKLIMEKSELNQKLQKTYSEKSELNQKLQRTYKEKSDRGLEIKKLRESWDYRIGHKLLWLPRKIKYLFAKK